jgi:hypothetical protein
MPNNSCYMSSVIQVLFTLPPFQQRCAAPLAVHGNRVAKRKIKKARIGHKHRVTKEDTMAWYESRFEGIILVCTSIFFSWTLLMLPLSFFSCCRNEYSSSRLVVLLILRAMTYHLLHLHIPRMPILPKKSNVLLRGYISLLYSASPQCANTEGPGERVETLLRTQTHGTPIIRLFFSHPWLCTLRAVFSYLRGLR